MRIPGKATTALLTAVCVLLAGGNAFAQVSGPIAAITGPPPTPPTDPPGSDRDAQWSGTATFTITQHRQDGCAVTDGSGQVTVPIGGDVPMLNTKLEEWVFSDVGAPTGEFHSQTVGCSGESEQLQTTSFGCTDPGDCGGGTVNLGDGGERPANADGSYAYHLRVGFDLQASDTFTAGGVTLPGTIGFIPDVAPIADGIVKVVVGSALTATVTAASIALGIVFVIAIVLILKALECKDQPRVPNAVTASLAAGKVPVLQQAHLTAVLYAYVCKVISYTFQWKRTADKGWTQLAKVLAPGYTATYRFKPKVAGHEVVRVIVDTSAGPYTSQALPLITPFPNAVVIFDDLRVQSMMKAAWQQTLHGATPRARHELCFFILLDTRTGKYFKTSTIRGATVAPDIQASCPLPARPADHPLQGRIALKDAPVYVVAWFHTHTPTLYNTKGRPSGASPEDYVVSRHRDLPGAVYDYTVAFVPARYPLHSAARVRLIIPPGARLTP